MILTWCLSAWARLNCRAPNRPAEPGTARPMNQSSPSTCCYFLTLSLVWPHSPSKMSMICLAHCGVSSNLPYLLLSIQPKISLHWLHPPLPLFSFFSETASFLALCHVCILLGEDLVDCMHDAPLDILTLTLGPLG